MNDKKILVEKELLQILEEAIVEEQASHARYKRGSELAMEAETREMFEKLAADELIHEQVLKDWYYQIKKRLGLKVLGDD